MKQNASRRRVAGAPGAAGARCVLIVLTLLSWMPAAQAQERVLLIATAASDEAAARRTQELLDAPSSLLLAPAQPLSDERLRTMLAQIGASYALVFDAQQASVRVFGMNGARHTRTFAADKPATPYEAAFVATELLALARVKAQPRPPPALAPRRVQLAGRAALELAGFYQGLNMVRPSLAFDLRPRIGATAHRLALGGVLGLPGRHEQQRGAVEFELVRWDTQLRLGFAADFGHTRLLAVAQARLARTGVAWSGEPGAKQHGTSLGFGPALEAELAVSAWFGLFTSLGCDVMTRRNLYRIGDLEAFREDQIAWSALFGLVITSPARVLAEQAVSRAEPRAY